MPQIVAAVTSVVTIMVLLTGCQSASERLGGGSAPTPTVSASASPRTQPSKPNAQMQAVLDQLAALGGKPLESLSASEARRQPTPADAVKALLTRQGKSTAPEAVARIDNRMIVGAGGAIPMRVYWPQGNGPFPILVYYHGGGWVIADLDTYDASARALANAAGAVVVSSHYRQGPEHKFPAAHDDALEAYRWALGNASALSGDARRVAVAGESAGANLAAGVAMMARDAGLLVPVHQLLVYPVTGFDFGTPSYVENAAAKPLNRAMMMWFFGQYLRSPADGKDSLISLVAAPNLRSLPPATVITAEIDPLRSEGRAYADRLREAGVDVDYKNYDGVTHEFFGMTAVVDEARDAVKHAGDRLRTQFGTPPRSAARGN